MFYKVVTKDLKSLGLRKNPNVLQFGEFWVNEKSPLYGSSDYGGIWVTSTLSSAKELKKYFERKYGIARIFECEIGDILYCNSYRTKTTKVKLLKEIIIS